MVDIQELHRLRLERWHQTTETRIRSAAKAIPLIESLGVVTLYLASPEIPDLFHAYVGDPEAKPEAKWDSDSGEVFSWRWPLGQKEAAFYAAIVRKRPTWISWSLLPAILCLLADRRTAEELYEAGELPGDACRIAAALEAAGGTLDTGELRRQAGFPTGKEHRAAYLKALEALEERLLVAKVFSPVEGDPDMSHALIALRYSGPFEQAQRLTREQALDQLLRVYLPHAIYALPKPLAKDLRLPEQELRAGLERLVTAGCAERVTVEGRKDACYIAKKAWKGA